MGRLMSPHYNFLQLLTYESSTIRMRAPAQLKTVNNSIAIVTGRNQDALDN